MIRIELTDSDYDLLCYVLGVATGSAMREKNPELAAKVHALYVRIQESIDTPKTNEPGS